MSQMGQNLGATVRRMRLVLPQEGSRSAAFLDLTFLVVSSNLRKT